MLKKQILKLKTFIIKLNLYIGTSLIYKFQQDLKRGDNYDLL